jgi:YD repeat-containing protein
VADLVPALEQQVFHIPQAQWKTHVHQHHQPDHLWQRVEVSERLAGLRERGIRLPYTVQLTSIGALGATEPAGTLLAQVRGTDNDELRWSGEAQGGRLLRSGRDTRITYDTWGNRERETRGAGERVDYGHDANDQLVSVRRKAAGVIGDAGLTRFGYDALGCRAWKETVEGRVDFLWNGDVLLAESEHVFLAPANDSASMEETGVDS